jgi:hypothetical protein
VLADGVHVPPGVRISRAAVIRRADAGPGLRGSALGDLWVTPFDGAAT